MHRLKKTTLLITCNKCNKELTINHFTRNKKAKVGYDQTCKHCRRLLAIEREQKQKHERKKFLTEWIEQKRKNVKIVVETKKTVKKRKYNKRVCPMCGERIVQSRHHIIPRKYGENNDKTNIIWLCNKCHDIVEIQTEDWINSGKRYSTDILKKMIINHGL